MVERGERGLADEERANRPEVAEDAVLRRGLIEVVDARGAARARATADHALDHARVALAEEHELLLDLDDRVDDLARPREQREIAVALDEDERRADAPLTQARGLGLVLREQERSSALDLGVVALTEPLDVRGHHRLHAHLPEPALGLLAVRVEEAREEAVHVRRVALAAEE